MRGGLGRCLPAATSLSGTGSGNDFVGCRGEKLVDGGNREALLDAVAGGFVLKGRNGNDVDGFGEGIVAPADVIAAARKGHGAQ